MLRERLWVASCLALAACPALQATLWLDYGLDPHCEVGGPRPLPPPGTVGELAHAHLGATALALVTAGVLARSWRGRLVAMCMVVLAMLAALVTTRANLAP